MDLQLWIAEASGFMAYVAKVGKEGKAYLRNKGKECSMTQSWQKVFEKDASGKMK